MTAVDIIQALRQRGVELQAAGDRLRFRPKEAVPPDLLALMKERRGEILTALTSDGMRSLCPGQGKCSGCYLAAPGVHLHPPRSSANWRQWLEGWKLSGKERLQ